MQDALGNVEDEIQLARRYYNGSVRDLNLLVVSFPSNLIAKAICFRKAEFFEIEEPGDRAAPQVDFS